MIYTTQKVTLGFAPAIVHHLPAEALAEGFRKAHLSLLHDPDYDKYTNDQLLSQLVTYTVKSLELTDFKQVAPMLFLSMGESLDGQELVEPIEPTEAYYEIIRK